MINRIGTPTPSSFDVTSVIDSARQSTPSTPPATSGQSPQQAGHPCDGLPRHRQRSSTIAVALPAAARSRLPISSFSTSGGTPVMTQRHIADETTFLKKDGKIYTRDRNGHIYPIAPKHNWQHQEETITSIEFTENGLLNLREKYNEVKGAPSFVNSLLRLDGTSEHARNAANNPQFYPYFPEEKFLVIPNSSYDPTREHQKNPKAQKLKDAGITLCAWFIHPQLSCIDGQSRKLLEDLAHGRSFEKPSIEKLGSQRETNGDALIVAPNNSSTKSANEQRDARTIGELRKDGEYLASILDLGKNHIEMLKNLKENTYQHLQKIYGVNANDNIGLYFHFPYDEDTVTLHMHIRVNHGSHPFERGKSFSIDQIISGLSSGKDIDDIILERQMENGRFYKQIPNHEKIYDDIPGVKIHQSDVNIFALDQGKSSISMDYPRDDSFQSK